jgi:replication-associated recombination protein RarA
MSKKQETKLYHKTKKSNMAKLMTTIGRMNSLTESICRIIATNNSGDNQCSLNDIEQYVKMKTMEYPSLYKEVKVILLDNELTLLDGEDITLTISIN